MIEIRARSARRLKLNIYKHSIAPYLFFYSFFLFSGAAARRKLRFLHLPYIASLPFFPLYSRPLVSIPLLIILLTLSWPAGAEEVWVNNITLEERSMVWECTETFTGNVSIAYRQSIDMDIGNNDSFVSAWEVLKEDQEKRKKVYISLLEEMNIKVDNSSTGIGIKEVAANLSENLIGPVHSQKTIVNKYRVTYALNESLKNGSTIWFLGKAESPVTIVLQENFELGGVSGMENMSQIGDGRIQLRGVFGKKDTIRGEVVINLIKTEVGDDWGALTPTLPKPTSPAPSQVPWIRILAGVTAVILLAAAAIVIFLRIRRT